MGFAGGWQVATGGGGVTPGCFVQPEGIRYFTTGRVCVEGGGCIAPHLTPSPPSQRPSRAGCPSAFQATPRNSRHRGGPVVGNGLEPTQGTAQALPHSFRVASWTTPANRSGPPGRPGRPQGAGRLGLSAPPLGFFRNMGCVFSQNQVLLAFWGKAVFVVAGLV